MDRPDIRLASLLLVLAACPGDEVVETSSGSSTGASTGATTSDDTTGRPPTTTPTEPTEPTTEPPPTTTTETTLTTIDDTGTSTGTTAETDPSTSTTDGTTDGTTTDGTTDGTTDTTDTTEPVTCGNAALDPGEACDGDLLGDQTCASQGFDAGTLACAADCSFDTSACVMFSCGNDDLEGNEVCDGADLAGETCVTQGFAGGTLGCAANCGAFDTAGCFVCGNDEIDGPEVCDGADLGGQDCVTQGFDGGALACAADCGAFDSSACFACGDDAINGGETCDGQALGGATCDSQGFFTGTLACQADCAAYDTTMCTNCGNNTVDMSESCDGPDLGGETCTSQGFFKGALGCQMSCDFDVTGCSNCGNGTIEAPEVCDGNSLGAAKCSDQGLEYGYVCCGAACGVDAANCADELVESEPNDDGMVATATNDFSSANADGPITANTVVVGSISPAGDDDYYAVTNTGAVNAILTVETWGPMGPGTCPFNSAAQDTRIDVRDANNVQLATDDDSGIGWCSRVTNFVVAPAATVYVRIYDREDDSAIPSYFAGFDLRPVVCGDAVLAPSEQCDDGNVVDGDGCSATCTLSNQTAEIEPNGTNAQADMTGLVSTGNSQYLGAIPANADVDRYRLDLAQPGFVRLESFSKANDCVGVTTTLRVFNAANQSVIADTIGSGIQGCGALVFPLPAASSYVQVEETGLNATIPAYLLEMKLLNAVGNETEPNDVQAQASLNLQNGSDVLVFGDHSVFADSDFYAVTVPGCGGSLRLEVIEGDRAVETCESGGIDSQIFLYDAAGKLLDQDDDAGRGFCSMIDGTGSAPLNPGAHKLAPGTYFVQVKASSLANMAGGQFIYRLAATVRNP